MKTLKFKYCFILIGLLFFSVSRSYSQCSIELFDKQNDTLFFHSLDIKDILQCYAHVYLTYSNIATNGARSLTNIEITSVEMRRKSNNQKIRTVDFDSINQCICDTLGKYIRLYYNNPNRMLTAFELKVLGKYIDYKGNVKIGLSFSSIYIYPYRKKKN